MHIALLNANITVEHGVGSEDKNADPSLGGWNEDWDAYQ